MRFMSDVLVVGSINMDLVVKVDEIPKVGETLHGEELVQIPGGKGANQAVAISKLGNQVVFLGKVGDDAYGQELIRSMNKSGVDTSLIEGCDSNTGMALINVDKAGNNNIVVIPGANFKVDKEYLHRNIDAFNKARIVLLQLEIPVETVKESLRIAKDLGKISILNPAPAIHLDDEIIKNVDILIPNEHELERISKVEISDDNSLLEATSILLAKGIKEIIVTLGQKGVLYVNKEGHTFYQACLVDAVDTTAAGDSFIGGFIAAYLRGLDMGKAIDIGQTAASITVQRLGAQSSLPSLEEVEKKIVSKSLTF